MENTLVSVVLTCYNQEQYLAEALDSVLNQTYPYWECVILNDGSTDGSEEVAKRYVSRDKRFLYVYQSNQGVVAARNNAVKISKGDYILPLDGDDIISPNYIKLATDVLDKNKDVILVCCNVEKFGMESGPFILPEVNTRNILRGGCCVSSSMYRRVIFESVGGYKEEMSDGLEDWEIGGFVMRAHLTAAGWHGTILHMVFGKKGFPDEKNALAALRALSYHVRTRPMEIGRAGRRPKMDRRLAASA